MRWASRVKDHAEHVDCNVMVIPAKGDEIIGIMVASVPALSDVMWLQSVPAPTSIDLASALITV